MPKAYKQYEKR